MINLFARVFHRLWINMKGSLYKYSLVAGRFHSLVNIILYVNTPKTLKTTYIYWTSIYFSGSVYFTQSTVFYERVKLCITLANVFVLMLTLLCNIVRYFKYLLFRHNLVANELGYLVEICSYLHITLRCILVRNLGKLYWNKSAINNKPFILSRNWS